MLAVVSRIALGVSAAVLVVHASAGDAVPSIVALAAALAAPAAIVGASVPRDRRGTATTIVLAAVLLTAAAAVPVASRRISGDASVGEIVAWLVALLTLLGVAPAVVLGWAHASTRAPGDPERGGTR